MNNITLPHAYIKSSFNSHSKREWLRSFHKALGLVEMLTFNSPLQQKILKLTEQLRIEQAARDENVAEYLKLASNASDKQQSSRIKQVSSHAFTVSYT
uniref:Uncharacterized protein n=1 Tax=Sinocyclocheilus anshuiensis TaxID=1608454 RepID=A0A671QV26_9TELE